MKQLITQRLSVVLLIVILAVFVLLLIINETTLFNNQKTNTFNEAVSKQVDGNALNMKEEQGQFVDASRADVKQAMDIDNEYENLNYMDISEKVPMSEHELNQILKDKGILKGQAKAFLKAQEKYDVNVLYLISHALVETGHGRSELAKGIKDDGKKYYNFFGIGAFDENAVHTGSSYAKKQSWTSPKRAIMGGAKFVRKNYFDKKQITLYQMRWNPKAPGEHQYASDIAWDGNIARFMQHYYDKFGIKKDHVYKDYYL
ncbi:N-acetylglucosaminidase [Staphylococcus gallinarum]|uniref:N-acetylglucosaminidase n=1 Tax=Staphylococcus gallinarum TaxID=1293 RepID=UPI001E635E2A|nr:N-acetylglucosaminidase [Staphylococcus gallinarum]MCD8903265.1 N-acetylglucosaminidase [Staphylococcus gallinarum]